MRGLNTFYHTNDRGTCEIDFLLDTGMQVIPLEVKAEENLHAKSLKTFKEKYNPELSVRTSMSDYRQQEWLLNLPLYMIEKVLGYISDPFNVLS